MRILVMRHGEAVDPHHAPSDDSRWLTGKGRTTVRGVAGALSELGLRYSRIYTSPLVRAVQTAEILASIDWFDGPVQVVAGLDPGQGTTRDALAPLEHAREDDFVVLVGHEPLVRVMTGHLLGVSTFPSFRAGSACLLRWTRGATAGFEFLMNPYTRERVDSLDTLLSS